MNKRTVFKPDESGLRTVFLNNGRIEAEGPPETIFTRNENQNLRQFLKKSDFEDI